MIPDPEKLNPPEGWLADEPLTTPDPEQRKPDDWDDAMHGEWEAQSKAPNPRCKDGAGCGKHEVPRIRNPKNKGKWFPPRIPNPAYKGEWAARRIANSDSVEFEGPLSIGKIAGAGFEDWMVSRNVGFGNLYIGNDEEAVKEWNEERFAPKAKREGEEKKRIDDEAAKKMLEPEKTPAPAKEEGLWGSNKRLLFSRPGAVEV
jgi:calnexin